MARGLVGVGAAPLELPDEAPPHSTAPFGDRTPLVPRREHLRACGEDHNTKSRSIPVSGHLEERREECVRLNHGRTRVRGEWSLV